jgi:hypothetical protein
VRPRDQVSPSGAFSGDPTRPAEGVANPLQASAAIAHFRPSLADLATAAQNERANG